MSVLCYFVTILYLRFINPSTMKSLITSFLLLFPFLSWAQYEFSGKVNEEHLDGTIYLSVVDNYRKISGVFPEQIIDKTTASADGSFLFKGDMLPEENRIYRIHVDACDEDAAANNHFTGHCLNSQEVVFIANNNTKLELPFGFEDEMFCKVISPDPRANAFLKIDSLKNDMRFAFGNVRSEANRKLNSEKWFLKLQEFGEQLDEPLAELYNYAFLSDRTSNLYGYYLEDLKINNYYNALLNRLETKYPNATYTAQYTAEIQADKNLLSPTEHSKIPWWVYLLGAVTILSIIGNFYFFGKIKNGHDISEKKQSLSTQEQKVLDYILANKSNKEIAAEMFVSVSTVKTHINNLYKKLGVKNRDAVKSLYN